MYFYVGRVRSGSCRMMICPQWLRFFFNHVCVKNFEDSLWHAQAAFEATQPWAERAQVVGQSFEGCGCLLPTEDALHFAQGHCLHPLRVWQTWHFSRIESLMWQSQITELETALHEELYRYYVIFVNLFDIIILLSIVKSYIFHNISYIYNKYIYIIIYV